MAGLCTAYRLAKGGQRVAILTQAGLGDSETAHTTAHLTNILDERYFDLEKMHGEETARLTAESHAAAIDWIEQTAREESIDCDFERSDGYLFSASGETDEILGREFETTRHLGLRPERLSAGMMPLPIKAASLRFPRQARFHPVKFAAGLAHAIERMNGRIYCDTHVDQIRGGMPAEVSGENGSVAARAVVVATGSPISNIVVLQTKQAAYRTYVIGATVTPDAISNGLFWDTGSPYHYVRTHSLESDDGRGRVMLLVGGEDHKTGQAANTDERYERLEVWTRRHFPMAGEVEYRWSGQILEPIDGLAYIGPNPGDGDVYVVTGTSGNGMTYGAIGGLVISDLIFGRENPWAKVYSPSRITLGAAAHYLQENLNVAAYYTELATPGEVVDVNEILPDCGAVIRHGLHKHAVYRDENGKLHRLSAVCQHLNCIVHWNSAERSWDCPCHGSRYDRFGRVINGPSIKNLQAIDEAD
jgi:glycine/D-amino acid oxidase-like deaminating enzyme/nitrite reductase/ring-hydroxylating ferredoxin subunit